MDGGRRCPRTCFHASIPFGTPSTAFHTLSHALTLRFASSMIPSIRSPACSSHGNTIVCSAAPPLRTDEGDQSAIAFDTLGRISWSRTLSTIKDGRIGDQLVKSATAGAGSDGDQALLQGSHRQSMAIDAGEDHALDGRTNSR